MAGVPRFEHHRWRDWLAWKERVSLEQRARWSYDEGVLLFRGHGPHDLRRSNVLPQSPLPGSHKHPGHGVRPIALATTGAHAVSPSGATPAADSALRWAIEDSVARRERERARRDARLRGELPKDDPFVESAIGSGQCQARPYTVRRRVKDVRDAGVFAGPRVPSLEGAPLRDGIPPPPPHSGSGSAIRPYRPNGNARPSSAPAAKRLDDARPPSLSPSQLARQPPEKRGKFRSPIRGPLAAEDEWSRNSADGKKSATGHGSSVATSSVVRRVADLTSRLARLEENLGPDSPHGNAAISAEVAELKRLVLASRSLGAPAA